VRKWLFFTIFVPIIALGQARDVYGGLTAITVPNCNPSTAYFTVQLLTPSNHWEYVDPLCHPFMRFGVDLTGIGGYQPSVFSTRYGSNLQRWYTHTLQRMVYYNFNHWGDYSDMTAWGGGPLPGTNPVPVTAFIRPIGYALFNITHCNNSSRTYSGNLKDFQAQDNSHNPLLLTLAVWNSTGWNYHPGPTPAVPSSGQTPDVMDPYAIGDCTDWQIATVRSELGDFANNKNVADISLEDADFIYSWRGIGNDGYPHTGFLAAVVDPYVTGSNGSCGGSICGNGTTFWSKAAWACGGWTWPTNICNGSSYLEQKYGTVAAVCSSWGKSPCPYTTFASGGLSSGTCHGSPGPDGVTAWGCGTGLMDENGSLGLGCTDAMNLEGCPINFQTDVNNLLYNQVIYAVNTMVTHVRAYDTNHVLSALDFLGGENATTDEIRTPVLLGLRDAHIDVLHAIFSTARVSSASTMAQTIYNVTGKPIMPWYHVCAPADSPYSSSPGYGYCGDGSHSATQSARGSVYTSNLGTMYHLQGADGTYPLMGINWWAWSDPCNPDLMGNCQPTAGGSQEWGLSTWNDNIYNGTCAVIAGSTDMWGYPCGGETGNYGDFLDAASSENVALMNQLITDSQPKGQKKTKGKVSFHVGKFRL
jgi:hypothetical protein